MCEQPVLREASGFCAPQNLGTDAEDGGRELMAKYVVSANVSNSTPVTLRGPLLYAGALAAIAKLLPVWTEGKPLNLPELNSPRP